MPAQKLVIAAALLSLLASASLPLPATLSMNADIQYKPFSSTISSSAGSALEWLIMHQLSDGSYGPFSELQAAPAAYALWLHDFDSQSATLLYSWLATQLEDSSAWFFGSFGEADVPGEILYSVVVSHHLGLIHDVSSVYSRLLEFQQSDGGFKGYFDFALGQVTSSVDTAMALWGLVNAEAIPTSNQLDAIRYLFSLQNADGSFNLTSTVASDSLYSLGPEPISITALVVLVLRDAGFKKHESHVAMALEYLERAASQNFNGHVYAASLSALAFTGYHKHTLAVKALSYIVTQQNPDGGFRDIARFSTGSNALDTGWAAIALQLVGLCHGHVHRQPCVKPPFR